MKHPNDILSIRTIFSKMDEEVLLYNPLQVMSC